MLLLLVFGAFAKPAYTSDPKPEVVDVSVSMDRYVAETDRYCGRIRAPADYRDELTDVAHTLWYLEAGVGAAITGMSDLQFKASALLLQRPDLSSNIEAFRVTVESILSEWRSEYDRLDGERAAMSLEVEGWANPPKTSVGALRVTCRLRYQRLYEIGQRTLALMDGGTKRANAAGELLTNAAAVPPKSP